MGLEIERKFLIKNDNWRDNADDGCAYRQGYLVGPGISSVRVRIQGDTANLNIKSGNAGVVRQEFEYPIPLAEAQELLQTLCEQPIIEKTRYIVPVGEHRWEIDVFEGDNQGLQVAEIELASEDEAFERPDWLGEEVSDQQRYYNIYLSAQPFKSWPEDE